MSTTFPTTVRIEPEIETDLATPVLVALYGVLWIGFTLGGGVVALLMADFVGGLVGAVLFLTVGLGFVATGPTAARQVMLTLLARFE